MPRRAATMASSYCSPRTSHWASVVQRNRGRRAPRGRGLGRHERAGDEAERRDVRKPSAEPFGELARAQGELLEPGRVGANDRASPGRERLGPRPPRNVGADDRGPCPPDLELEQPIAELRDGGGEQIGDGARRSGPHKLVSYPVAARAASREWLPTSKSFILASSMAKPRRGDSLALTIDDLAFGGEGVGRVDGYVVFVRGGVPGDRLRVKLYEARSRFGRAAIEAVETPSPDRVEAPCPYFGRCGGCRLQHVAYPALREGRRTGETMVNIVASTPDVERLGPVAERLRECLPGTASVVLNVTAKKASVAVGTEEHLLVGRDHIRESLGGLTFQVSANSFFQTNTVQAERLFGVVEQACVLAGGETVLDLYSGTGAISLLLARRCRWVYGIEVAAAAVADAARNARANGIENCTFLEGEVRHVLPTLVRDGVRAEVVVADPPRAGFHPKALQALAALAPARLVYVSCNPATLARDLGDLVRQGYRLEWVQPVDMFPQTPHIEAVARLSRA